MNQISRTATSFALSCLIFIAVLLPPDAPAAKRAITVADMSAIKSVWGPRISPDGDWVVYSVTAIDVDADRRRSDLWLTSFDGNKTIRLTDTPENEYGPQFSPDGNWLAFSRGGQLWVMPAMGGEARQVGNFEQGIDAYDWAPDSKRLVVAAGVVPDGGKERTADEPIVIDRMLFKRDGYGFLGRARTRLHLVDVDNGSTVQLTNGPFDEIQPSFSPDGKHIAFVTKLGDDPDRHGNWDIMVIDAKPGSAPRRASLTDVMECDPVWGWSYADGPEWSPDSSHIACIQTGDLKYSWFTLNQVVTFDADGSKGRQPTAALDRNTLAPRYSADGKRLYFMLEDDQSVQLASVGTSGGDVKRLTPPDTTVAFYDLGPRDRVVLVSSTPSTPAEISVIDHGKLRQLTHVNSAFVNAVQLVGTEDFTYHSPDGTEVHGLIMKPPGFEKGHRYPAIFRLHGGPVAQWQREFDFDWQVLAAHGYVVVGPNPRGSSGRGEAYQMPVFGKWGTVEIDDILAGADRVVEQGIADPDRLGVGGWSSGAMSTNYTIASDTRFRAATTGAGVSNMLAGFGTDEWWQDWEAELGLPWETPAHWMKVSYPFLHADRIKTPTLFLVGTEDYNVPLIHSEQMYMALKRLGVPTELIVYPGESHGISKPSFQRDRLQRYLDWYDRWLQ